jgi:nicotinamidase-related amidase
MGYNVAPLAKPLIPAATVLAAARRAKWRIVHTRQGFRPDLADVTPYIKAKFARSGVTIGSMGPLGRLFVRGEPGWEIATAVAPLPHEPVIDKTANSAFIGTELDTILRGWGVDKLVIMGNTLDCCVHCTLRQAADMNYQTLLVEDCCGCVEIDGLREAMIESVKVEGGLFGTVTDSTSLVDVLQRISKE